MIVNFEIEGTGELTPVMIMEGSVAEPFNGGE